MNFPVKFSNASLILLFYLVSSIFGLSEVYGQISVKKWADNRKSAFSFTFDDACMSHYTYATPVLDSFNFKGTFFVITDSSIMTDDLPAIDRYGTWKQFRSIGLEGHEIGSHTVTHAHLINLPTGDTLTPGTLLYELYQSKKTIEQKITNQKCITLSYPYQDFDPHVISGTGRFYESARCGSFYPIDSSLTGSGFYKIGAYEEMFTTPRDSTSDDLDELQDMETYEQSSITNGKWGMLEVHEVVPFSQIPDLVNQGSWYPISTEWLTSLCEWLKQKSDSNLVWVETMGNVTLYMKEREQFQYNIVVQTETQMQINVTDNLNDQKYIYPLTVDITVPPDWQFATVIQGSRTDTIKTIMADTSTIVRAHVIPDGGILILNKTNPPCVVTLIALIQGLYDGSIMTADTVTLELHNAVSPYALVESQQNILDSSGIGTFNYTIAVNGTQYYLAVKHRNSIETWSATGQSFVSNALSYDFTTSQNQAYDSNLIYKGTKWCIYSGDVTQDGQVSFTDLIAVDNDDNHFVTGNTVTDLTGDKQVTFSDLIIVDNNNTNVIRKFVP